MTLPLHAADHVEQCRTDIYNYFQSNTACLKHFSEPAHDEEFVAYYNSMYLLQDSTESLWLHRRCGFTTKPLLAYLEFWGVMQAVTIQQDSISEIYKVVIGAELDAKSKGLNGWLNIRRLRNTCAGHPAITGYPVKKNKRKDKQPVTRTFMPRKFGNYDEITYEQWHRDRRGGIVRSHPRVQLGKLLDSYFVEAALQLTCVLEAMKRRWP